MDFRKLTEYLDSLEKVGVPCCDLAVWQDHRCIYRHHAGWRDAARTVPADGREVYRLYSTSKVILAVSVMRLKEAGLLQLDDPLEKYLPAFRNMKVMEGDRIVPAKTPVTIRNLLAMQGGFDYDMDTPEMRERFPKATPENGMDLMMEAMAARPLHFHPGKGYMYSLCHDVLGAVVAKVSGMRLSEYYKKNIFDPLEMPTISFEMTADKRSRLADLFVYDGNSHTSAPLPRSEMDAIMEDVLLKIGVESAGGGLIGDVDDYIRFADALANDGVGFNGYRLISRASIDEMRVDHLTDQNRADFVNFSGYPEYGYGLGVRTLIDESRSRSPLGEFGWNGAAGAWTMIDTDHRLSAFYAQHIMECGYCYAVIHPTIRDLIYACMEA